MRKLFYISLIFLSLSSFLSGQNNYGIPDYNTNKEDFKFRFNLELGYGNWNKTINNGTQDFIAEYYHGLKDGFDIETGFIYYLNDYIGLGLTGMRFDAYNKLNNVYLIDDSTNAVISIGYLEDDIRILFIGTTACYSIKTSNKRNILLIELSPGYIFYKNKKSWVIYKDKITGQTFGLDFALTYDFKLTKILGIGIGANILFGSLKEFRINDTIQKLNQAESMTRVNFTAGFNIYL